MRIAVLTLLASCFLLQAQTPLDLLSPIDRATASDIMRKVDFYHQARTVPRRVRLATLDQLFAHPRLTTALWRQCHLVPTIYAFEQKGGDAWTLDDGKGLTAQLTLVAKRPGIKVYLISSSVEGGRLMVPFRVSARVLAIYRDWESPKGYESAVETWTALDSAFLGAVIRPFRGKLQKKQNEFITYIHTNITVLGAFAAQEPQEYWGPLQREGDPVAIRDFKAVFMNKGGKKP